MQDDVGFASERRFFSPFSASGALSGGQPKGPTNSPYEPQSTPG